MKNANLSRLGGFTLIELLVVVLIIGILAAMALPEYSKAVERSRMAEAVTLMDSVVKSQRRKYMQTNRYAEDFRGLDVSPKGASGRTYFTDGDPENYGAGGNGFSITLQGVDYVQASRRFDGNMYSPSLRYQYSLIRYYHGDNVMCRSNSLVGQELCADFCGIDSPTTYCCNNGTIGRYCLGSYSGF